MGIADPCELTARPGVVQCRQLSDVAEFATVQHRWFNPMSADRRRPESRSTQIEPEAVHAIDLCSFHRRLAG
ncbi:hypothetical protein D9M71_697870 [compost metagenome]